MHFKICKNFLCIFLYIQKIFVRILMSIVLLGTSCPSFWHLLPTKTMMLPTQMMMNSMSSWLRAPIVSCQKESSFLKWGQANVCSGPPTWNYPMVQWCEHHGQSCQESGHHSHWVSMLMRGISTIIKSVLFQKHHQSLRLSVQAMS